jgi:hypothetical protein
VEIPTYLWVWKCFKTIILSQSSEYHSFGRTFWIPFSNLINIQTKNIFIIFLIFFFKYCLFFWIFKG